MTTPTLLAAPIAALLSLLPTTRPLPVAGRAPVLTTLCRGVEGRIDARAAHLGLDLHGFKVTGGGAIHGTLEGDLRLEVRREARRGADTEISIRLVAATPAGSLKMEGTAFAARERSDDPLHAVHGWLDVSDPSTGTLGRVRVEGTADTRTRVIAIGYAGELCGVSTVLPVAADPGPRS